MPLRMVCEVITMTHKELNQIIDEIHKNKNFRPNEFERRFLEDLSLYATIGNIQISEKQSAILQKIYKKSQGG